MKSRPARIATQSVAGGEKTKEQLKEDLRKTREELAIQKWGIEKTLGGMKVLVKELIQEGKEVDEINAQDAAILASIGDGLVVVNKEGKILMVNNAFENLVGWKAQEVIGRSMVEVVPREDEKGNVVPFNERILTKILSSTSTSTSTTTTTWYYIRKDKTRFPAASIITPFIIEGKIIGAIEVFRNITRETEIDKAKSEFVSLASHQLRTPLGIMKWYLEALENEDYFNKAPAEIRMYFDEIYKNNERVLSLVRDLLSVSRIEQRRVKNIPKSVDLIQVIKEIVEQMQIVARKKNVLLHLTIGNEKTLSINIDILRFREVIENLIVNAIEYTVVAGTVSVTVNKAGDTILISVADTGIGILEADQKKLFTKFFRSEKAIGLNPEGSGLGLYVAKSYVEGWGGKISVENNEGKGSTFTISLPMKGVI